MIASALGPSVAFSGWAVAAIVGIVGFGGRILTLAGRQRTRLDEINEIERRDLADLIQGKWYGTATEAKVADEPPVEYRVEWDFKLKNGKLFCDSPARYIKDGVVYEDQYRLECKVAYHQFLLIEYFNKDRQQINFGTELIEISPSGREFSGKFVGYSSGTNSLIHGSITGTRNPPPAKA